MITIFGTTYYTWLAPYPLLFIIAFLVFLMLVFMLDHWIKKRRIRITKGLAIWIIVLFVLEVILFWDVVWVAHEAKRLCKEEGGLHVYKTVEVESLPNQRIIKEKEINRLLDLGYGYVVNSNIENGKEVLYRYSKENGLLIKREIYDFSSRYQMDSNNYGEVINRYLKKDVLYVTDKETGCILSEAVLFSIYPGRVDSWLLGKSGLSFTPWFCGDHGYDLFEKTLLPKAK